MGSVNVGCVCRLHFLNCHHTLQWRHNERHGVSIHRRLDCLPNRLFRRRSKKTSKLRVSGLWEGSSPVTGEFSAQRASNAENYSIWWSHHDLTGLSVLTFSATILMSPALQLVVLFRDLEWYIGPIVSLLCLSGTNLHTEAWTKWLTRCRRHFQIICFNKNCFSLIPLRFVAKDPVDNKSALVNIMP